MCVVDIHTVGGGQLGDCSIRIPVDEPLNAFTAQCLTERFAKAWLPDRLNVDGMEVRACVRVLEEESGLMWSFVVVMHVVHRVSASSQLILPT